MSLKETCSAYSTPMMDFYPDFKFTKKVGLIELFAGYGSQSLALEYLGVDFTHIGISEWNWKSVLAYKKLHFPNDVVDYSSTLTEDDLNSVLFSFGISSDWNLPMSENEVKRLRNKREIYNAIVATKDHPDISRAKGADFALENRSDFQTVMTYSFPCQDLSNAGKMAGMDEGSETRSSLLWQVKRIISEMGEIKQLPDFLLMENVPGVAGEKNLKNLGKWISFLESLGYKNKLQIMEATDYGIPQTRKRAFLVSVLGDYSYSFPGKIELSNRLRDLMEEDVDEKYYLSEKQISQMDKWNVNNNPLDDLDKDISPTILARGSDSLNMNMNLIGIEEKKQEKKSSFFDSYNKKEHENVACTLTLPNHNSAYIVEREASGVCCGQSKDFQRVPLCLNPTLDGKQPSIENRVYSPDGTFTAVTASFPTKDNIGLRIRKLTPRECFRLMGVSDDRSQSLISSFSDSVLYHLASDSIVTTCLMAILSQCLDIDWVAKAKEAKLVSHK